MFKLNPLVAAVSLAIIYPTALLASDTGDAPASYGLATHEVVTGAPRLGEIAPDDNAPAPNAQANGDDNGASPDDEDGVFAFPRLVENFKEYDVNVFVYNPTSQPATLVGWIDFNGNGTFEAGEASTAVVPAGAENLKIKLAWPDDQEYLSDYVGTSYARFRISSDTITADDASGGFSDGEVEDYTLPILLDSDGDDIPDSVDLDNDNDGIPDAVEGTNVDTDGDGTPNYLDVDSDDDSIPDYAEAGPDANNPVDTDGDSQPDYLDLDSNNDNVPDIAGNAADSDGDGLPDSVETNADTDGDGIINSMDIDSDNDVIPDAIEAGADASAPVDTDGDLIPDFLDLDSDNDGIPDIHESNSGEISIEALDDNDDGAADTGLVFGANGFVDDIETSTDSGVPIYAIPDTDADGVRDFRDLDSDDDNTNDLIESGAVDADNNGIVDTYIDADADGITDAYDIDFTGGVDADNDQIDDAADTDFVTGPDVDGNGILDTFLDANSDGIADSFVAQDQNDLYVTGILPDLDDDFIPDFRDEDAIGGPDTRPPGGTTAGQTDAGTTAGETTTGTTAGTTTNGGTTDGGTAGGTTAGETPTNNTAGSTDSAGIVETGLSGSACSVSGVPGTDPLFPGLALLAGLALFVRRRSSERSH